MSASSSLTTSVDIASFAAAMHASRDLSRSPSVSSRSKTAVRAPEPSSRTAFTRRSGSPLTSPWRRHAPFLRTRRHSGQRYTRPEPSRRSIKMPRTVVEPLRRRQQVRLQPGDRRPLVEAHLRDAPPRFDVGPFDADDLVRLEGEVLPRAELRLAGLVREDAGEDGLSGPVDLDLAPLDGQDARGHGDVRRTLPQVRDADRRRLADVRLARAGLEFRQGRRGFL